MTVDELIQLLARHSPGLREVVNGYENGYDDLSPEQLLRGQNRPEHRETPMGRAAWRRGMVRPEADPTVPRWSKRLFYDGCRTERNGVNG